MNNIFVSNGNENNKIKVSGNSSEHWAMISKNWAVSDSVVEDGKYSAKYYALAAKTSAENASATAGNFMDNVEEAVLNYLENAMDDIDESVTQAIAGYKDNIEDLADDSIAQINAVAATIPNLSTVATSGNYNDLFEKPLIPSVDFINQSKGKKTGDVSINAEILASVTSYAHSTFDVSKFMVVGSPIITDDGIASGFSSSNDLLTTYTFNPSGTWEIKGSFTPEQLESGNQTIVTISDATYKSRIIISSNGKLGWYLSFNNSSYASELEGSKSVTLRTINYFKWSFDGAKYLLQISADGQNYETTAEYISSQSIYTTSSSKIRLGKSNDSYGIYTGSIDLKQFSIVVDGVPVFSGNKTGVDKIAEYNKKQLTPNGDVTVTNGIASNFATSASNYIKTAFNPADYDNFEFNIKFHLPSSTPSNAIAILGGNNSTYWSGQVLFNTSNEILIGLSSNHTSFDVVSQQSIGTFTLDTDVWLRIKFTGAAYVISYSTDGSTYTDAVSVTSSSHLYSQEWILGNAISFYSGNRPFKGTIDLTSFQVISSNVEVITGSGEIPYNLSKTGLKITDKLDRAIDIAEQCGFSQYFGLDEANQLCLVPQGENITGRRDLVSVEEDANHNVIEYYSDFYCKQSGSCTSGTAITFAQPYKDDNAYKLNVPYSAKSKTGFTPSASGDYTAEGHIYLT